MFSQTVGCSPFECQRFFIVGLQTRQNKYQILINYLLVNPLQYFLRPGQDNKVGTVVGLLWRAAFNFPYHEIYMLQKD